MFLYLNTASYEKIILALIDNKGAVLKLKKIKAPYQQSEKLLSAIEKLKIKSQKLKVKELKGIIIVAGPGSFTSLRIGLATANTLAWACQISIIGVKYKNSPNDEALIKEGWRKISKIKRFKQVLPFYGQEPNIGRKNKKHI